MGRVDGMMSLTPATLQAVYEMLVQVPPFRRLKLPPSCEITFEVYNEPACYGEYEPEHIIRISRAKVGHLDTLIKTMAHEMVHCLLYVRKDKAWDQHTGKFEHYANRISSTMGFDPKEF